MKNIVSIFFVALVSAISTNTNADEWSPVKSSSIANSVELTSPERQIGLVWSSQIIPGEDLLLMKTTFSRYQRTNYLRYVFLGISGGSMHIAIQNSPQSAKGAQSGESIDRTIFVERSSDEAFAFIPEGLKNEAYFKISKLPNSPGEYSVSLNRFR